MIVEIENKTIVSFQNFNEFEKKMSLELVLYNADDVINVKCSRRNIETIRIFFKNLKLDKDIIITEF